ncbi:4a-hydroxytetrahydrobiopterin dehydratase [Streptomyces microflavus]|uniref:4a-hydroxytetrahydrobiopterin dehydratase n=1 Tax=Streptomyces microflavus TaxID=1919 RepID=UPI0029B60BCD|nr:4a-hydroxytetrahydrobiopterin dehydratase [Streptomyces microflavus]MDX2406019.1 4a-hydroxytetrahydrobiopterin dehydratase [Streptomyces microflavus]
MSAEPLSRTETERRLEALPGWALEGDRITRTFRLPSHFAAAALTVHIAQIQEELNHHSDLTLGYNTVALSVHTHDAGGAVTEKDLELAARVAAAAPAHGAE